MFDFLKIKSGEDGKIYLDNAKEASIFLDKSLLLISSLFIGFIFNKIGTLHSLKFICLLKVVFISMALMILLIIISYIITSFNAELGYSISENRKSKNSKNETDTKMYTFFEKINTQIKILYLFLFVISTICFTYFIFINI